MKVVLGSTSEDKKKILKNALSELHLEVEVVVVDVDSGIIEQPLDKKTTKKGATNRALKAKKAALDADFWLGLEGGLHDYGEGYHLITFACLIDKEGSKHFGEGEEIHLPSEVSKKIKQGEWFGKAIRAYAQNNEINENLVTRLTPFTRAAQGAYVEYLKQTNDLKYRQRSSAVIKDDKDNYLIVQMILHRLKSMVSSPIPCHTNLYFL